MPSTAINVYKVRASQLVDHDVVLHADVAVHGSLVTKCRPEVGAPGMRWPLLQKLLHKAGYRLAINDSRFIREASRGER